MLRNDCPSAAGTGAQVERNTHKALGAMAGAVEALAIVRMAHMRALVRGCTKTTKVSVWLEELAAAGDPRLAVWRREANRACAMAMCSYEGARGTGPCVVPEEDA